MVLGKSQATPYQMCFLDSSYTEMEKKSNQTLFFPEVHKL